MYRVQPLKRTTGASEEVMVVRITGQGPLGTVGRQTDRSPVKKNEGGEKAAPAERVELSAKDAAGAAAKSAASGVDAASKANVAELRAKIASGEYRADLKLVAERIIAEAVAFDGV
jgi:anti-sigma28 factor (negative regulator of flagellin synthesis)